MAGKLLICAAVATVRMLAYFGWKLTARGAYSVRRIAVAAMPDAAIIPPEAASAEPPLPLIGQHTRRAAQIAG